MTFTDYRTAVVTGATSGLGRGAVELFLAKGLTVHAIARDVTRLAALADLGVVVHPLNVRDTAALNAALHDVEADIVFNAAGVSRMGNVLQATEDDIDDMVEVNLTGDLRYGVNWYLENGIPDADLRARASQKQGFGIDGGSIVGDAGGFALSFLGHNVAALLTALDRVTDLRLLQTPSVVVKNNAEATFNVGSRIPVASVTVNPGSGNAQTYSQVQYLDTGTILKVRPRVTRDGMVFLDIVQEVSSPGSAADIYGNVRINTRRLKTEAAVQSGDTVMLAGLISARKPMTPRYVVKWT